jgi:hypothetical protein
VQQVQYESIITVNSEVLPGVEFDVYKPSYGRKMEFDLSNAVFRFKVREIKKQHEKASAEWKQIENEFTSEIRKQVLELEAQLKSTEDEGEKAYLSEQIATLNSEPVPIPEDLIERMTDLAADALRVTSHEYNPRRIEWGLAAVRGLTIDGENVDAHNLIAKAPHEFTLEVLEAIDAAAGMSNEQLKNLSLPITSSGLVGMTKSTTSATAVSEAESTAVETAVA